MKWVLTYLLTFFLFTSFSQKKLTDQLEISAVDSLHIYPSKYSNLLAYQKKNQKFAFKGTLIPRQIVLDYRLDTLYKAQSFIAIQKFYLDASEKTIGIILGLEYEYAFDAKVILLVMDSKKEQILQSIKLAYYTTVEGSMEDTMNAWIMDINKDGNLDVAIISDLIDYELPNENAENISGTSAYTYLFKDGQLIYEYMEEPLFHQLSVIK